MKMITKYKLICFRALAMIALIATLGCGEGEAITELSLYPPGGIYPSSVNVNVEIPPTATNVYMTTDTKDPIAATNCQYSGSSINITRPTTLKIAYEVDGTPYNVEHHYIVEDGVTDSGLRNREIIFTWERLFIKHIISQFNPPYDEDSELTINDEQNGRVNLNTTILDSTLLFDIPEEATQKYTFDFYLVNDAETGENVMLERGAIYAYRGEHGGYYTTLEERGGRRIHFGGTYDGWAEGDFRIDEQGKTVSGYYQVYCSHYHCPDEPVTYMLDTKNNFIEISPATFPDTVSCEEPSES